jgi:exopolyphosphatase/guanosine-5'-triphosphate,3'-diphosphate pyrophosphatase
MALPINIAAIDAGSNAIRLLIAHAVSPAKIYALETERAAVRLGHHAFTRHLLDPRTLAEAVEVFRAFRRKMQRYDVVKYRAVATSASREARNRREFVRAIRRRAGLRLQVIDGAEEARLVRLAVLAKLSGRFSPRLIFDLGGGSLELNQMKGRDVERTAALPVGTVRLMEMFGIEGRMNQKQVDEIRDYVLSMLATALPARPDLSGGIAVACGGNAEAFARIAAGPELRGVPSINVRLLHDRAWEVLRLSIRERMKKFGVRRDRAEVMGIAGVVFSTLGRWLRLSELLVPGVGVREGVLRDLVLEHFGAESKRADGQPVEAVLAAARQFAARMDYDAEHAEHVRRLAASLFDQLWPVHRLRPELRLLLELGAVLHDVGHIVNSKAHHKHGEYIVRNAAIDGLAAPQRDLVACLVRYHSKAEPEPHHRLYAGFPPADRRAIRALAALLRVAEGLDADHRQLVRDVEVVRNGRRVTFRLRMNRASRLPLQGAARRLRMFEDEFGVKVELRRSR